jgi:hypothetical protein
MAEQKSEFSTAEIFIAMAALVILTLILIYVGVKMSSF